MDVQISMETTFDDGTTRKHRLVKLSRSIRVTHPEALGLLLEDAKVILGQIQEAVLTDQVEEVCAANRICPECGSRRAIHDHRTRVLDTLFGRFRLRAPRFRRCRCDTRIANSRGGPFSPVTHLFPNRATPELLRLQAELGSRHSFREAARGSCKLFCLVSIR